MTLSQRAAALAGPDRAVDAEIAVALGYVVCPDQGRWRIYGKGVPKSNKRSLPRFTGSMDAAMTVVPEGWAWMTGCAPDEGFFATLSPTDESGIEADMVDTFAATPALALLSAALAAWGL